MRTALALVFALLAPLAWGGTSVVVLDPAASGEHVFRDADVTGAGATITGRAYGLLYVDGSAGAATALAADSGVKYVQAVGEAEPPSPHPRPEPAGGRRIVANQVPPTWISGAYQYDGAGNIYAIGDATLPGGNGTKIAYTYDTLSRLRTVGVSDTGHPSLRNESYTYDPYGNLTGYVTPTTSGSIVTNAANNRVTSLGYDQAGSVTSDGTSLQYVRDPLNMIVLNRRVGGTDVNLYTADEERVAEGSGGYWTWSFRGFDQKVLRQYRSPATNPFAPWLWVEDYVYAGSHLVAAERPPEEGRRRHFHLDHLGTPRLVTGDFGRLISQHDYTAYGIEYGPDSGTASNQEVAAGFDREEPMRFTGHERGFTGGTASDNATSHDYMHARHYVATMGRFLSVDPQSFWQVDSDSAGQEKLRGYLRKPQEWNRYTYVSSNPVKAIDPDGRATFVITTFDYAIGSHSAVLVSRNGTNALFDPAGSYRSPRMERDNESRGSGDVLYGEDAKLSDYVDYQKSTGSDVKVLKFDTTPKDEAAIKARMEEAPGIGPGSCTLATSSAISGVGRFKDVKPMRFPGRLYAKLKEY